MVGREEDVELEVGQKVIFKDDAYAIREIAEVVDIYSDHTVSIVKIKLPDNEFRILMANSECIEPLVLN